MAHGSGLQSLFSQQLDRAVFATYFLGAVVPFLGLALVTHRYALPALGNETYGPGEAMGLVGAVGGLTLASFFALRRLIGSAIARMSDDNRRLAELLELARRLASQAHREDVASCVVEGAATLASAEAAWLLLRSEPGKGLDVVAAVAAQGSSDPAPPGLIELAEDALEAGGDLGLEAVSGTPAPGAARSAMVLPIGSGGSGAEGQSTGALVLARFEASRGFHAGERDAARSLAALAGVALHSADLQGAQRNFFSHVTDLVVAALDAHVDKRSGHASEVARMTHRLGREFGLEEARLHNLHFACLLHDIGMLKIPRAQQREPAHFQKHPLIGSRMLGRILLWKEVAPIVLAHHERYDGSGYPDGRRGEDIPLEARLMAVSDSYEAMRRDDHHRRALTHDEAIQELRTGAGTQFDPQVVIAFIRLIEQGELPVPD